MVESHTISAPEDMWKQVFDYSDTHNLKPSQITVLAWNEFFKETKTYRTIDIIIVLLLNLVCLLIILGVWIL